MNDHSVIVLDSEGKRLNACSKEKARALLAAGRAKLVAQMPLTIQLRYAVHLPTRTAPRAEPMPGRDKRLLMHICCGPCATYPINRMRDLGFDVVGYWYNPNIQPYSEHERRRECIAAYANSHDLPMIWEAGYETVSFIRAVVGNERFGQRCAICYQMRLSRAARAARENGFDALTTTLLISPHQDQNMLRRIGEQAAEEQGIAFFFENLRRGWAERGRLAREHGLYRQQYCGCIYSEWEAQDRSAWTAKPPPR